MERERLTRLVQDAAAVDRTDLAELDALAERFPWFAGAQILRATGMQRTGEVLSKESLHTAAAHLPSRTALFDLIHRPPSVVPERTPVTAPNLVVEEPEAAASAPVAHPTEVPNPAPALAEPAAPIEVGPATARVEVAPAQAEVDIPAIPEETPPQLRPVGTEAAPTVPPTPTPPEDPLDRQIMESALSHAYDISWLEAETPKERKDQEKAPPVDLPTPQPVVPIAPIHPKGAARCVTRHDRLSFTEWLDASQEMTPPEAPGLKKGTAFVPEAAEDWLHGSEARPTAPDRAPLAPIQLGTIQQGELDTKALIDRFIQDQAPASPTKAAFFTPQQAAKRSLDDKAGLVTETLARVYAKQGNLPKAIDSYKRLALKYPEKSAYFAALQKELEAQLNK